jgi:hypothetical protein
MIIVKLHILNFQRDLVVGWIVHIELKVPLLTGVKKNLDIYIYIIPSLWAGHVARMGEERGVYRVLVWKPEGKRPLGIPRRRWMDNIRIDLQEVGCGHMDWIGLAQDRDRWRMLVSAVMNLRVYF